jgi:hypothetical protein
MDNPPVGSLRNVVIENITATGANVLGSSITGLPGYPVENITLKNVNIAYNGGGTKEDITKTIEELPGDYPEGNMFGTLPSYGLYIRHASRITLKDITLGFENIEERPPVLCEDVKGLKIINLQAKSAKHINTCVVMNDVEKANIKEVKCIHN